MEISLGAHGVDAENAAPGGACSLWAEPSMLGAAVSGRAATLPSTGGGRPVCAGDKRSLWRGGARGNKSRTVRRGCVLRVMVP